MAWWIELPAYLMGSLLASYALAWVFTQPVVMGIWERHFVGPVTALLVVSAIWVFFKDPNLHTLGGLASFLHSEAGY